MQVKVKVYPIYVYKVKENQRKNDKLYQVARYKGIINIPKSEKNKLVATRKEVIEVLGAMLKALARRLKEITIIAITHEQLKKLLPSIDMEAIMDFTKRVLFEEDGIPQEEKLQEIRDRVLIAQEEFFEEIEAVFEDYGLGLDIDHVEPYDDYTFIVRGEISSLNLRMETRGKITVTGKGELVFKVSEYLSLIDEKYNELIILSL